jgi:hypothetical protein
MRISTKDCAEPPADSITKQHATYERHCRLFFSRVNGSTALKVSESGTSFYLFSMDGEAFDLESLDVSELEGTGELQSSSGAVLRFNSYNTRFARFRNEKDPAPYRLTFSGQEWKGLTWFIFRDGGGSAAIDNLEFTAVGGQP